MQVSRPSGIVYSSAYTLSTSFYWHLNPEDESDRSKISDVCRRVVITLHIITNLYVHNIIIFLYRHTAHVVLLLWNMYLCKYYYQFERSVLRSNHVTLHVSERLFAAAVIIVTLCHCVFLLTLENYDRSNFGCDPANGLKTRRRWYFATD